MVLEGANAARFISALDIIIVHLYHLPKLIVLNPKTVQIVNIGSMGVPLFYVLSAFGTGVMLFFVW